MGFLARRPYRCRSQLRWCLRFRLRETLSLTFEDLGTRPVRVTVAKACRRHGACDRFRAICPRPARRKSESAIRVERFRRAVRRLSNRSDLAIELTLLLPAWIGVDGSPSWCPDQQRRKARRKKTKKKKREDRVSQAGRRVNPRCHRPGMPPRPVGGRRRGASDRSGRRGEPFPTRPFHHRNGCAQPLDSARRRLLFG